MTLNRWIPELFERILNPGAGVKAALFPPPRPKRRRRGSERVAAIAAIIQTLEDRTLLSGGTVFPFIAGNYTINGLTATITQDGDSLTLTNELGSVSSGDFLSETQIIAHDWEGGLVGDLHDGWIAWANGTVWFDPAATPDGTDYSVNGGVANTLRDGTNLAFTNELGDVSQGYYLSGTQVVATGWEAGLVGDLVADRIEWRNGTVWTITSGVGLGAPQFDPDSFTFVADEDAAIGTVLGTLSATDPQGQALSYSLTDPAGGSVPFAVDSAGTITVNATLDYALQNFYSLKATATDTEANTSVAATVEIYVNDSTIPQASSTARTTLHDMSLTDTIVYDAGDEDADPLTFVIDTLPANGTLYDSVGSLLSIGQTFDGNFRFDPAVGFVGTDSFTWHANDGDNDSNVATLTVNVYNTKPQAWGGWYGLTVNAQTSGDLTTTSYDEDASLAPDVLTVTVQTLPANGTLTDNFGSPLSAGQPFGGLWQYFPASGFTGSDSFIFFASDSIEAGNVATIQLTVAPNYNAGPLTANDDVTATERGTPVNIAVLQNDGSMDGTLSISAVTQGAHGTVTHDTVEITYTPTDPLYYGKDTFQYEVGDGTGASVWATVDVYMYWIDLDVNNNASLLDPVDGTENYLPGYVGDTDVLSTGTEFSNWQYLGQQMRVIVEGIGSDAGVNQVVFELLDVTKYDGYSENTSDAAIEGSNKDKDFSSAAGENQSLFVATGANIEPTRSWSPLWAKDYGGDANIRVSFQVGTVAVSHVMAAFKDEENGGAGDGLPDEWEEQMVREWNSQYGTSETVSNAFFNQTLPKELPDPDGASNTDGGRNLPSHLTAGDSLSVLQEWRGFLLDGGTFIGEGPVAPPGHRQLLPYKKELLVEVDMMSVTGMPHSEDISSVIMQNVANGFGDPTAGSGIHVYWVMDQRAARYKLFANTTDRKNWATSPTNRTRELKGEFVHLMFADFRSDSPGASGTSSLYGSYVFIKPVKADATANGYDLHKSLASTAAHEITHLLLNTIGANGFTGSEHMENGDTSDPARSANDKKYLMYPSKNAAKVATILFADQTIGQINLISKESVERIP